ncbi:MAG: hypothetical protein OEZ34_17060 [Spirochaetia bacterium]|nr:hypothetical protein [Spirochaetia bacterium]
MKIKKFIIIFSILFLISLISFQNCKKEKDQGDMQLGFLSLFLLSASNTNDCQNSSGFVICIPPGLRF